MRCLILFLILWSLAAPLAAQQPAPAASSANTFPSVSEVIPRLSKLKDHALQSRRNLEALGEQTALLSQIEIIRQRQEELTQRIAGAGDPGRWSFDRIQEIRESLAEQKSLLRKQLESLSENLAKIESVRLDWATREEFWRGWQAHLKETGQDDVPQEAFEQSYAAIAAVTAQAAKLHKPLVELQNMLSDLQTQNQSRLTEIGAGLRSLRTQTFRKTGPSFVQFEFYRQFNIELWQDVRDGVLSLRDIDWHFLKERGWVLVPQVLLVLCLGIIITRHRRKPEVTQEWQFILNRPWATGIFVAMTALGPLYFAPPSLWRFVLRALAASSAALLVCGLLKNPRKVLMVYLLTALFVLSSGLQLIDLPSPLYRLYLTLLSLLGIPFLLILSARNLRARKGIADGFTIALRLGAIILGLSLLAQFAGYSNLASWLIEASVASIYLWLFVVMALKLGRGGIEYLFSHPLLRQRTLVSKYGKELTRRLQGALKVFIIGSALLSLLVIWGLYDSPGQAWAQLLDIGFNLGEIAITIKTVLLVGLVIYLSIVTSWFVNALLDTQVFPYREFDRGVSDAIKKLLHYFLVFIGFILAMSMAGLELKNLAVLAGAFGIGIGFGLQNIVNNFISGIILLFERPIKVGDMVVLAEEWGTVRKIGLRSTIVETLNQSEIIVPNSMLISDKVTNWTLSSQVARLVLPVGVAYGSNVPLVLKVLHEAAVHHPDVLSEPRPSPIFTGFGDSSLNFELRVWIKDITKRLKVISELNQAIDQAFRDSRIEIPFPQRDLHLRSAAENLWGRPKGEKPATPPQPGEPAPASQKGQGTAGPDQEPVFPESEEDPGRED